jgi:tetratricopeptide (TPR) repeat protein
VVALSALNGSTGDSLASEQVEVESKEQVLKSLDKAASDLRQKMGESLASVQQFAVPLEQATTSSLEALQAFTLGQSEHQKMKDDAALVHLKKAVELDPNFAMAWATMGVALSNMGRGTEGAKALKKAYELRDRASEREKFYIQAHYYDEVTLETEKSLAVYDEWRQTYPRDTAPYDNAALASNALGRPEKALEYASQAHRIDPQDRFAYDNMSGAYESLNRFDEAKSISEEAVARKLDGSGVHFVLNDLAYMRGDHAAAEQQMEAVKGSAIEPVVIFFNAAWQTAQGKVNAARELWQRASQTAVNSGAKDFGGGILTLEAYDDALFGLQADARQVADRALAISNDPDTRWGAAMAFAMLGDEQKSSNLLASVERDAPENRFIQGLAIPQTRATQRFQKNQFAEAIKTLEPLRPYEFGTGPRALGATTVFLRGMAYLKMRDGAKAAAEFQRILDHRGAVGFGAEYPLSHLNLGRAWALQGDTAKARTAYQDFFSAWKDADADIPLLKTAKAEYEKLK